MLKRGLRLEAIAMGYEEIFRENRFPKTGEVVRCRQSGTLWRVMEREIWQKVEEDSLTGESWIVPYCYFSFWRIQDGVPPRVGEMLGYLCNPEDDNFAATWEVLYDTSGRAAARKPAISAIYRLN
jgi:hypothetical protein